MRPEKGVLVCIRCTNAGRARTVLAGGRRITLAAGQQGLGTLRPAAGTAVEPTLKPQDPSWRPPGSAARPHPQLGLFPYDEIRDGQKRFTRDVTLAVQSGKHLVAQAPTGIGKTAAALAPALQAALDGKKTVLFLTSRQSQHRIAVETLRKVAETRGVRFGLVDLVAKRDMCLRPEAADLHPARFPDFCGRETRTKSCQYLGDVDDATLAKVRDGVLHVEELMAVSKKAHLCPHLVALAAAKQAQVVVADYNHLFSDLRDSSLERLGLKLQDAIVVVDEAHNLPERIRQNHSHRVGPYLIDQVEAEARSHKAGAVVQDLAALRACLSTLTLKAAADGTSRASFGNDAKQVARLEVDDLNAAFEAERSKGMFSTRRTLADFVADLGELAKKVRKQADDAVHSEELGEALDDWGRFRDGALRYIETEAGQVTLHVRLLDPALPAASVFHRVHSAILMSGTLRPPEMVRDVLGLDASRTAVRSYPSPFPPQNRLTLIAQGYSTRYSERGAGLWDRIAVTLARTIAATKGNVAVFAPSYAVLRDVKAALDVQEPAKASIVEEPGLSKADRDQVVADLAEAKAGKGAILYGVLGGSFAEGVDFKGNLLSVVAVVGLPLAPPDLEVEAMVARFEQRFPGLGRAYGYTFPAMSKVLQAMGRGIRGPDDKCVVLLLDERYLGPPYRGLLPEDAPVQASREPEAIAAQFLKMHGL